ncbi:hypothetical protein CKY28_11865 [Sphingomonas lenta]|uniref:DUF418 domain-containing protein n=2 Tax=Sphingomonas lenta TaxID=1141887 RepID=A0A2A2SGR7_9SPHN|nr:hypothetical protein CKY28_11865 [Sphingomonas lenta]
MGILVANLPAFGLPRAAYFSPSPWGGTGAADIAAWTATFVLVEGKMRGLFSFLFGASMLLVIDRATQAGETAFSVHYQRMFWLFLIGLVHLYGLWWGDILAHYALVGAAAFFFTGLPVRGLIVAGAAALIVQAIWSALPLLAILANMPGADAMLAGFGAGSPGVSAEVAAMRGGYAETLSWRAANNTDPFSFLFFAAPETLGYMLWGMAGLKSGFLTAAWERRRYARWAAILVPSGLALYLVLAAMTLRSGFDPRYVLFGSIVGSTPIRPVFFLGYVCLIVLAARPGGWLTERVAAVGRTAFTNYLGTTLLMTAIFQGWGLGMFGRLGRAEMYLLVPVAWALMLAWSKPWLERYRYGPLEWLWRSLARLEVQPLRLSPRVRTS